MVDELRERDRKTEISSTRGMDGVVKDGEMSFALYSICRRQDLHYSNHASCDNSIEEEGC